MFKLSIFSNKKEIQKNTPIMINGKKNKVKSSSRKVLKGGCCFKSR